MKTLTTKQLRDKLVEKLNFKTWTQNGLAKNSKGKEVKPLSKDAIKWCVMGLACKFYRVSYIENLPVECRQLRKDFWVKYNESLIGANDNFGFKKLKQMLNKLY